MAQGRRLRSTSLHVLILALVVQGATPDCHDLASLMLFQIPCFVLGSSGGSSLDSAGALKSGGAKVHAPSAQESGATGFGLIVSSDETGEPTLDEVCESALLETTCRTSLNSSHVPRQLEALPSGLIARLDPAELSRLRGGSVPDDRDCPQIAFLCRLIC